MCRLYWMSGKEGTYQAGWFFDVICKKTSFQK